MRFEEADTLVSPGNEQGDACTVLLFAVHFNFAAMIPDDPLYNHQSKTASVGFASIVGFENMAEIFGRKAMPGIFKREGDKTLCVGDVNVKAPPVIHGLYGVFDQIEKSLAQLSGIAQCFRGFFAKIQVHMNAAILNFLSHEVQRVFE